MRRAAAVALGTIGDPQAIPALITALNDENLNVREAAVHALGTIGDPQAIPPLITALDDQNQGVRKAAAGALDTLHWSPGRDATGVAYWMGKGDWDRCVEIGVPAIAPLTTALNDENLNVREAAVHALGTIGGSQAIPPLTEALNDRDSVVRNAAAVALGTIGDPQAIPALITALNHKDWSVRKEAVIALGKFGDPQAIPPLITALNDHAESVRKAVAAALGTIGDPQAIPALITALNDHDGDVRKAAADALHTLHWSPGRDATGVAYWMGKGNWDRCVEIGVPAIEPLTKALNNRDWHVRKAAANSLVAMYSSIKGTVASRQILAARSIITASHVDWTGDCSHSDEGIGVRFPP